MKVLFISRDYRIVKDGGSIVTLRNLNLLKIVADEVIEFLLPTPTLKTRIKNILFREGYAQTSKINCELCELLKKDFDIVFLNSSLYGVYSSKAKRAGKTVCCFYHNVERKYYLDKFKINKRLQDLVMIPYVNYCEKLSTNYSDYIITLNERDNNELMRYYRRKADFIFPTSFDSINTDKLKKYSHLKYDKPYALFVGSNFFANVEGLQFLFKEVAPYVNCDIMIVGSVCEAFQNVQLPQNIVLKGIVDDLFPYYANAVCVVSPIFSGSGLKTKTIEALRYGKTFIGSEESFVGIDKEYHDKIGMLCHTSTDYIDAINRAVVMNLAINEDSLSLFDFAYSNQEQAKRLDKFLKGIVEKRR